MGVMGFAVVCDRYVLELLKAHLCVDMIAKAVTLRMKSRRRLPCFVWSRTPAPICFVNGGSFETNGGGGYKTNRNMVVVIATLY